MLLNGSGHILLIEADAGAEAAVCAAVAFSGSALRDRNLVLVVQEQACEATRQQVGAIQSIPGVQRIWQAWPLSFVKRQAALWNSAQAMIATAEAEGLSLGETAARYEAHLLGLSLTEVIAEMARRVEIMLTAVRQGLAGESGQMQLLQPTAASIYRAEANGQLAVGGLHTRAAARAMAAMHVNCGMGVVCAAPTAGSAGVLPGVLTTLIEECGVSLEKAALCLLAAGAIGVVVAERATFAAEVAGCQVEIGAAGAMAAGAVVEYTAGMPARPPTQPPSASRIPWAWSAISSRALWKFPATRGTPWPPPRRLSVPIWCSVVMTTLCRWMRRWMPCMR